MCVVCHQIPRNELIDVDPGQFSHVPGKRPSDAFAETPQRNEMLLRIEQETILADLTIEMNGQLRDSQQRSVIVHQNGLGRCCSGSFGSNNDAAGEPEITIQPRIGENTAVDLNTDLLPACRGDVGVCSYS